MPPGCSKTIQSTMKIPTTILTPIYPTGNLSLHQDRLTELFRRILPVPTSCRPVFQVSNLGLLYDCSSQLLPDPVPTVTLRVTLCDLSLPTPLSPCPCVCVCPPTPFRLLFKSSFMPACINHVYYFYFWSKLLQGLFNVTPPAAASLR